MYAAAELVIHRNNGLKKLLLLPLPGPLLIDQTPAYFFDLRSELLVYFAANVFGELCLSLHGGDGTLTSFSSKSTSFSSYFSSLILAVQLLLALTLNVASSIR